MIHNFMKYYIQLSNKKSLIQNNVIDSIIKDGFPNLRSKCLKEPFVYVGKANRESCMHILYMDFVIHKQS